MTRDTACDTAPTFCAEDRATTHLRVITGGLGVARPSSRKKGIDWTDEPERDFVENGDSVAMIAARYGCSVQMVRRKRRALEWDRKRAAVARLDTAADDPRALHAAISDRIASHLQFIMAEIEQQPFLAVEKLHARVRILRTLVGVADRTVRLALLVRGIRAGEPSKSAPSIDDREIIFRKLVVPKPAARAAVTIGEEEHG